MFQKGLFIDESKVNLKTRRATIIHEPVLYPLASGTYTFPTTYTGTVTVSRGNHIDVVTTANKTSRNLSVDVSTLSANTASLYNANAWKHNTTTIFTLNEGDEVSFVAKNIVKGSVGTYNAGPGCVLYDYNQSMELIRLDSTGDGITVSGTASGGTVTAVGLVPGCSCNGATISYDIKLYVNGVRYI